MSRAQVLIDEERRASKESYQRTRDRIGQDFYGEDTDGVHAIHCYIAHKDGKAVARLSYSGMMQELDIDPRHIPGLIAWLTEMFIEDNDG